MRGRRPFHGPCREPPCVRRCSSPHGYCNVHKVSRIYQGSPPPSERRRTSIYGKPCKQCGNEVRSGGAKGWCSRCYKKLRYISKSAA